MQKCLKTINAEVVKFEKSAQVFIEQTVTLPEAAVDLLEPVVEVVFDDVVPLRDKVIVQGRILKNLLFKTATGYVRHLEEEIPFAEDIDVPGYQPGTIHKERFFPGPNDYRFFVEPIVVRQFLLDSTTVLQKVVLRFDIKILRQEQLKMWSKPSQVFHTCDCTKWKC